MSGRCTARLEIDWQMQEDITDQVSERHAGPEEVSLPKQSVRARTAP